MPIGFNHNLKPILAKAGITELVIFSGISPQSGIRFTREMPELFKKQTLRNFKQLPSSKNVKACHEEKIFSPDNSAWIF